MECPDDGQESNDREQREAGSEKSWIEQECQGCDLGDVRLEKRFAKLIEQISGGVGDSIPLACQDWANTKAAYRFFSNDRVSEEEILRGHFQSTRERFGSAAGPVLILHDTSEFVYKREDENAMGLRGTPSIGKAVDGRSRLRTVRGILMHSSLAVTSDGLPLGQVAIRFWTRKQFKGCNALKRKINPTRVPIEQKESFRWIQNPSAIDRPFKST